MSICAFSKGEEIVRQNEIKRVLLLVLLIVSVVELDWERVRIYFLSSLASILLLLWSELSARRKLQKAANRAALLTKQRVSTETCLVRLPDHDVQTHLLEIVDSDTTESVPPVGSTSGELSEVSKCETDATV